MLTFPIWKLGLETKGSVNFRSNISVFVSGGLLKPLLPMLLLDAEEEDVVVVEQSSELAAAEDM